MNKPAKNLPKSRMKEVKQAVVLGETFNAKAFHPVTDCPALLPLANRKLFDYVMEWLSLSDIDEVVVLCWQNAAAIRCYFDEAKWTLNTRILLTEGAASMGDAMRALDRYAIIRGNFLLLSANIVGNFNVAPLFDEFRTIQSRDKNAVAMILYKEGGLKERSAVAFDQTGCILFSNKQGSKVKLPIYKVLDCEYCIIRTDFLDTGVVMCSAVVPLLYSDNFDFQTQEDFVRSVLQEDEISCNSVYCRPLRGDEYAIRVDGWSQYEMVTRDVLHRWTFPLVPDLWRNYEYRISNVYTYKGHCKANICYDSIVHPEAVLGAEVSVYASVVGKGCRVEAGAVLKNSFLLDDCHIGPRCILIHSVIGKGCEVKGDCRLEKCKLGPYTTLAQGNSYGKKFPEVESCDSDNELESVSESDSEASDLEDEEEEREKRMVVAQDDAGVFYGEVLDSLTRGYEDGVNWENLILEVNSSRYAYNVSLSEVNTYVTRAILRVEDSKGGLRSKLSYFIPVLKNYVKSVEGQIDCLEAVKEAVLIGEAKIELLPKVAHFLYDQDIISEGPFLKWYEEVKHLDNFEHLLTPFVTWLREADEESEGSSN